MGWDKALASLLAHAAGRSSSPDGGISSHDISAVSSPKLILLHLPLFKMECCFATYEILLFVCDPFQSQLQKNAEHI